MDDSDLSHRSDRCLRLGALVTYMEGQPSGDGEYKISHSSHTGPVPEPIKVLDRTYPKDGHSNGHGRPRRALRMIGCLPKPTLLGLERPACDRVVTRLW
jgi:hypothetical protein